jgi:hypothetical protein
MERMTMHCDEAIERLPWLLNGTLEPEEREQVRAHLAGCPACRQAWDDTRLAWEVFDQHLPPQVLLALASDQRAEGASGIDRGLAERHLAECPRCAAEVEMVRASRALLENEGVAVLAPRRAAPPRSWRNAALAAGLAGLVAATGWYGSSREVRSLESRLAETGRPAPPAPAPAPAGGADRAAALEQENRRLREANVALSREGEEAAEQIARLQEAPPPAAALNTPIVDLYTDTTVRGEGGEPANQVAVPRGAELVQLILNARSETAATEVELADASGRVVWKGTGLVRSPDQNYTVTLGRRLLQPPGSYTLTLYGTAGGKRTRIESFPLNVR